MKRNWSSSRLRFFYGVCGLWLAATASGQDGTDRASPSGIDASRPAQTGYTVLVDVKMDATGRPEEVRLVEAESPALAPFALALAQRAKINRTADDEAPFQPVRRISLFFPVEGDGGPSPAELTLPVLRNAFAVTYPMNLRLKDVDGGAILQLTINREGRLKQVTTLRASHPEFADAAREALKRARFAPAKEHGRPRDCVVNIAFAFQLAEETDWQWYVAPRPAIEGVVVTASPMRSR